MQPLYLQYVLSGSSASSELHFSTTLHRRDSDFTLFQNDWNDASHSAVQGTDDLFSRYDTELLKIIVTRLMQDDACITKIIVHNNMLEIKRSLAVSLDYIVEIISEACPEADYEVIIGQKPPSQKWLQETAKLETDCCPYEPHNTLQKLWWRFFPPSDPYADGEV